MRIIYRTPDGIIIPALPSKIPYSPSTVDYKSFKIYEPDGSLFEFGVLKTKSQARNFIWSLLSGSGYLPYMTSTYYYPYMKDAYIDDMIELAKSDWTWLDDAFDESLSVITANGFIDFESGDYSDAVKAIALPDLERLLYGNANEYVCYRCFIYWDWYHDDIEDGEWR